MTTTNRRWLWFAWALSTVALTLYFGARLKDGEDRTVFLPGGTSAGHHQIELACEACHVESFTEPEQMQSACESCHLEALDEARDAHPNAKFTDPRNADRVAQLDARYCVTCHIEHKPEVTNAMGLTIPEDYCVLCHRDIGTERPSHDGMAFETCASAGCHNFHDNRALYEDFLLRHFDEPRLLTETLLPERNFASIARYLEAYPKDRYPVRALGADEHDAVPAASRGPAMLEDWATTAHAASGVNCTACHVEAATGSWHDVPGYSSCAGCHVNEAGNILQSRHGMRLDVANLGRVLEPMRVADARLPMKASATELAVDCGSCHGAHRFDTAHAAVDACLGCHDDEHSRAYIGSPHHELLQSERRGELPKGSAVTCASCHMPRVQEPYEWGAYVHTLVQHNQSDNLRPNDKMMRPVCMQCHGYGFSINALSDRALIDNNFSGSPSVTIDSLELARQRRLAIEREREAARDTPKQ